MRKSALLQDLHNKKNYFEEGAFNGASSFFLFVNCFRCPVSVYYCVGGFFLYYTLEPDTFIIHKLLGLDYPKGF